MIRGYFEESLNWFDFRSQGNGYVHFAWDKGCLDFFNMFGRLKKKVKIVIQFIQDYFEQDLSSDFQTKKIGSILDYREMEGWRFQMFGSFFNIWKIKKEIIVIQFIGYVG